MNPNAKASAQPGVMGYLRVAAALVVCEPVVGLISDRLS